MGDIKPDLQISLAPRPSTFLVIAASLAVACLSFPVRVVGRLLLLLANVPYPSLVFTLNLAYNLNVSARPASNQYLVSSVQPLFESVTFLLHITDRYF